MGGLPSDATQVLDFWFGNEEAERAEWFRKDPAFDGLIASRFGALIDQALAGGLRDWDATAQSALARIVVLDQFTRNRFRDSARAFAGDALALQAATALVEAGGDRTLGRHQRAFAYLPFEHAEDRAAQQRSIALFSALAAEFPQAQSTLDWALKHQAVIERFGRYPHRNALLGRVSTADELAFLAEPGSRF